MYCQNWCSTTLTPTHSVSLNFCYQPEKPSSNYLYKKWWKVTFLLGINIKRLSFSKVHLWFQCPEQILKVRSSFSRFSMILPETVGFLKIVGEIQQLGRKRSQKINFDVILHYISLPIYPLHFPKFCPIQKQ